MEAFLWIMATATVLLLLGLTDRFRDVAGFLLALLMFASMFALIIGIPVALWTYITS